MAHSPAVVAGHVRRLSMVRTFLCPMPCRLVHMTLSVFFFFFSFSMFKLFIVVQLQLSAFSSFYPTLVSFEVSCARPAECDGKCPTSTAKTWVCLVS